MVASNNIDLSDYFIETEQSRDDYFVVYRGRRKSDQSPLLIWVVTPLFAADEFFVRRLRQVTRQAAQLEHPNIVITEAARPDGGWLYWVQSHVDYPTLAEIIERDGPFSLQRMQLIAAQIASALDYAHQKSVMHGSLSAQQIYVGPDNHVLIANFGLTQAMFGHNLPKNAAAITCPETLAPERAQGQGPSRPADLYALGILCYQMLAKKPPFTGPASTVLHAQTHLQPRPLYQVSARVPVGMSKVVARMLSKGVELRYNTGAEFIRALAMAQQHHQRANRFDNLAPIGGQQPRRAVTLKSFLYLCSGLVVLIFLAGLFTWAGYELGVRQAEAQSPTAPPLMVTTTIPLPTTQKTLLPAVITPTQISQPAPTQINASVSDTLLPTRLPSPTPQPPPIQLVTSTIVNPPADILPSPTPLPPAPVSARTAFVFQNPTGHDLIVDVTGPTPASALVPPHQQHEFVLEPGLYQYIVHTPTGQWLESIVGRFDLAPGQTVERDYYSHRE